MRHHLRSCVVGVSCLPFLGLPALAGGAPLPTGGKFVSGAGDISHAAMQLTVSQTTKYGIIDWKSFSIGQGDAVQINNGGGATLNRVTLQGNNFASQIDGTLKATGSVYLVNQNGIIVAPTGQVFTGGSFIATTRDTPDSAFMLGGNLEFTGNSSKGVDNEGTINSANGDVVLIGKTVTNGGTVAAPDGMAAAVAGDDVLLQPGTSGLRIKVNTGSGDVTNSGNISAAQAMLNAVGGNVYALAGNNNVISATGTAQINGHVWLTAGGSVSVNAPIESSAGSSLSPKSGAVTIVADGHGSAPNASVDGVYIDSTIEGDGPISITGTGGNNGAPNEPYNSSNPLDPCVPGICNYGVEITGSFDPTTGAFLGGGAILATGSARIKITGTGGGAGGTSFGNDGVFNTGLIMGGGGAVSIVGTGGASKGPNNFGVTNEGVIGNTGNGDITVTGTSGADGPGAEVSPLGVGQIGVANLGYILGGTGNISITGTVGANATGIANFGIAVGTGAISTGGNGNITLNGMANGQGYDAGIYVVNFDGLPSPAVAITGTGNININGSVSPAQAAGNETGVQIQDGVVATGGNVTITGNTGPAPTNQGVVIGSDASVTAGNELTITSNGQ